VEQLFIQERKFLHGVSAATEQWYKSSFKAFAGALDSKAAIVQRISELKQLNFNISINTYLRAVTAYFMWLHKEHGRDLLRIPKLREEEKLVSTFTREQVARIVNGKPVGCGEVRARIAALTALDSGMRIQELLNLKRPDVDFDNLMFRVHGKGNKYRLVPMSIELRKLLFRYLSQHKFDRVLATAGGTSPSQLQESRD
jgi:integrase